MVTIDSRATTWLSHQLFVSHQMGYVLYLSYVAYNPVTIHVIDLRSS